MHFETDSNLVFPFEVAAQKLLPEQQGGMQYAHRNLQVHTNSHEVVWRTVKLQSIRAPINHKQPTRLSPPTSCFPQSIICLRRYRHSLITLALRPYFSLLLTLDTVLLNPSHPPPDPPLLTPRDAPSLHHPPPPPHHPHPHPTPSHPLTSPALFHASAQTPPHAFDTNSISPPPPAPDSIPCFWCFTAYPLYLVLVVLTTPYPLYIVLVVLTTPYPLYIVLVVLTTPYPLYLALVVLTTAYPLYLVLVVLTTAYPLYLVLVVLTTAYPLYLVLVVLTTPYPL